MENKRTLTIDAEEVEFGIKLSGQAMAVPEGLTLPEPEPFLGATARRDGKKVWSGVVSSRAEYLVPITEQFSDGDLERLYRTVRGL